MHPPAHGVPCDPLSRKGIRPRHCQSHYLTWAGKHENQRRGIPRGSDNAEMLSGCHGEALLGEMLTLAALGSGGVTKGIPDARSDQPILAMFSA